MGSGLGGMGWGEVRRVVRHTKWKLEPGISKTVESMFIASRCLLGKGGSGCRGQVVGVVKVVGVVGVSGWSGCRVVVVVMVSGWSCRRSGQVVGVVGLPSGQVGGDQIVVCRGGHVRCGIHLHKPPNFHRNDFRHTLKHPPTLSTHFQTFANTSNNAPTTSQHFLFVISGFYWPFLATITNNTRK